MTEMNLGRIAPIWVWLNRRAGAGQALWWLIALNVLLRGVWLLWMHPPQMYDFDWYYTHAVDLYAGRGYRAYGAYTAYWPMGYPYFLSLLFRLTGPSVTAGLLANAALSIGIVLLVYTLAQLVGGSRRFALVAALAYTLLPSQIEWNAVLGSEELSACLALSALTVYVYGERARGWRNGAFVALAGLLLGVSCMVRPIPLFFPLALLAYERCGRRRTWTSSVWRSGLFGLTMVVGVSPVTLRNWVALHHLVPISTNGGVNLWQGTMANGSYFWSWNPYVNPLLKAGNNQLLENAIGIRTAYAFMLHHPFVTLLNGARKLFFLYWVDWNVVGVTFAAAYPTQHLLLWGAMWFDTVVYWLLMGIAVSGLVVFLRRPASLGTAVWVPLLFLLYNTAVFFYFPAWDRFRYPIMPVWALFFAAGLRFWLQRRKSSIM